MRIVRPLARTTARLVAGSYSKTPVPQLENTRIAMQCIETRLTAVHAPCNASFSRARLLLATALANCEGWARRMHQARPPRGQARCPRGRDVPIVYTSDVEPLAHDLGMVLQHGVGGPMQPLAADVLSFLAGCGMRSCRALVLARWPPMDEDSARGVEAHPHRGMQDAIGGTVHVFTL